MCGTSVRSGIRARRFPREASRPGSLGLIAKESDEENVSSNSAAVIAEVAGGDNLSLASMIECPIGRFFLMRVARLKYMKSAHERALFKTSSLSARSVSEWSVSRNTSKSHSFDEVDVEDAGVLNAKFLNAEKALECANEMFEIRRKFDQMMKIGNTAAIGEARKRSVEHLGVKYSMDAFVECSDGEDDNDDEHPSKSVSVSTSVTSGQLSVTVSEVELAIPGKKKAESASQGGIPVGKERGKKKSVFFPEPEAYDAAETMLLRTIQGRLRSVFKALTKDAALVEMCTCVSPHILGSPSARGRYDTIVL